MIVTADWPARNVAEPEDGAATPGLSELIATVVSRSNGVRAQYGSVA
jgi:hypothetical protein